MIKKICVLVLLFCVCFSGVGLANDGGAVPDYEKRLTYEVYPISKELVIGEEFKFSISFRNHTENNIDLLNFSQIFDSKYSFELTSHDSESTYLWLEIPPHKTVNIEFSVITNNFLVWYKKDGEYYAHLAPQLFYLGTELYESNGETIQYQSDYFSTDVKTIPIKIANLKDGSDYLNINVIDDIQTIVFADYFDYKHNWCEHEGQFKACLTNQVKIENISEQDIKYVTLYCGERKPDYSLFTSSNCKTAEISLRATQSKVFNTDTFLYIPPKNLSYSEVVDYKAIFEIDGEYKAISTSKRYNVETLSPPQLKLSVIPNSNSSKKDLDYSLVVENISHSISNFFFRAPSSNTKYPYKQDRVLTLFEKGSQLILNDAIENNDISFDCGYVLNDILYYWKYYFNVKYDNVDENSLIINDEYFEEYNFISIAKNTNVTPSPSLKLTPSPCIVTKLPNTPLEMTNSTSIPDPSPKVAPVVLVENVTIKPFIPIWVWVALGIATICVTMLVIIARRKEEKND